MESAPVGGVGAPGPLLAAVAAQGAAVAQDAVPDSAGAWRGPPYQNPDACVGRVSSTADANSLASLAGSSLPHSHAQRPGRERATTSPAVRAAPGFELEGAVGQCVPHGRPRCSNPNCWYLVLSPVCADVGLFCCALCRQRLVNHDAGRRLHGPRCQKLTAPRGAALTTFTATRAEMDKIVWPVRDAFARLPQAGAQSQPIKESCETEVPQVVRGKRSKTQPAPSFDATGPSLLSAPTPPDAAPMASNNQTTPPRAAAAWCSRGDLPPMTASPPPPSYSKLAPDVPGAVNSEGGQPRRISATQGVLQDPASILHPAPQPQQGVPPPPTKIPPHSPQPQQGVPPPPTKTSPHVPWPPPPPPPRMHGFKGHCSENAPPP